MSLVIKLSLYTALVASSSDCRVHIHVHMFVTFDHVHARVDLHVQIYCRTGFNSEILVHVL